jgi:hypothetical protein
MVQPGMVSCVASLGFLLFAGFFCLPLFASSFPLDVTEVVEMLPNAVASVVAMAWMMLLLSRRWRFEQGWIDTLGIILGGFWIVDSLIVIYFVLSA